MPYATNHGVRIHFEVEGQGPPVVLQHGFAGTLESWRDAGYARELSREYRLIMVDARGCGGSDKPHNTESYGFRSMVADLVVILDNLKINRAHYFGYSMGGRIGLRIPIYAPERFSSLVLGASVYPITGKEDAEDDLMILIQQSLEAAIEETPEKPMEGYLAAMEKRFGPTPPERRPLALANDPWALIAAIKAFRGAVSPRADDILPHVTMPCLLFVGEADPRFPSVRECAGRMPNARFLSLPGLDHLQGFVQSNVVLPHVKQFLAEAESQQAEDHA